VWQYAQPANRARASPVRPAMPAAGPVLPSLRKAARSKSSPVRFRSRSELICCSTNAATSRRLAMPSARVAWSAYYIGKLRR